MPRRARPGTVRARLSWELPSYVGPSGQASRLASDVRPRLATCPAPTPPSSAPRRWPAATCSTSRRTTWPRPRLRRRDVRLGHHDPLQQPGGATFLDLKPVSVARDPAQRPAAGRRPAGARPVPARADRGRARAGRRRGDAVPQRRRGAAPQRRPGRRPALRLRHVLHGRRAHDLRLLRPARPQGAVHPPRARARRTGSSSATRPASRSSRACGSSSRRQPLSTYFVTAGRRALPRASATSTTASRSGSAPGRASRPTSTRTPTSCSR